MKSLIILFYLIFGMFLPAASQKLDVSMQVDSLNDMAFRLRNTNKALSIKLARESLKKATQASYQSGIVNAKMNMAVCFVIIRNYDSALYLLQEIKGRLNDEKKEAFVNFYLGRVYSGLQNYEKAKVYFAAAEKVFVALTPILLKDEATQDFPAAVPNSLGSIEFNQANYNAALEHYERSLQITLRNGTPAHKEFNNIALAYIRMKEYKKSREFARQSIAISTQIKDTLAIISTTNVIGMAYNAEDMLDSAYYYFNNSQLMAEQQGYFEGVSNALLNKSGVMRKKGQTKLAITLLRQNLAIVSSRYNVGNVSSAYLQLAMIFKETNIYDSAVMYAQKSYTIASKMNHTLLKKDNAKLLSDVFRVTKQYDSAFKYNDLFLTHLAEYEKANRESQFSNLRVQLETSEKEQQINVLRAQAEITTLRNGRLILAITCLLLVGIIIIGAIIHRTRIREKKNALEQVQLRAELDSNKDRLYKQTLYMININNCLDEIQEYTNELMRSQFDSKLVRILSLIKTNRTLENEWTNFNYYFTSVHSGFYEKLDQLGAELTMHEKRVCALVKLNMSNREIATLLSIEPKSVTMLKYRIKKKLGINDLVELEASLQTF